MPSNMSMLLVIIAIIRLIGNKVGYNKWRIFHAGPKLEIHWLAELLLITQEALLLLVILSGIVETTFFVVSYFVTLLVIF